MSADKMAYLPKFLYHPVERNIMKQTTLAASSSVKMAGETPI